MKYLTKHLTEAAYEAAASNLAKPHVALIADDNKVHYIPNSTPPTPSHEYVDLGLPSGTLWATMNVGASSVTDYGNYYQYGKGAATYQETSGDTDYEGTEDPLAASADTAAQVWGGQWHMPTSAQCLELIDNTTYTWETDYQGSGINGGTFTSNGQTLFIPAAGYYDNGSQGDVGSYGYIWSSSPNDTEGVYYLYLSNAANKGVSEDYRQSGFLIRPVMDV